ncbi:adenosylhomocysteinase [Patescibacteria group bacterium]|nr:adenosylhomocysteinase [Patescibacteria group bacterium]
MKYDVKNLKLASQGKKRIEWADKQMQVLALIRKEWQRTKPLKGQTIAACLHVTSETANLMRTLKDGGAQTVLCASNPLSTQDEVAASLVKDYKIPVLAIKGEDNKTYYRHLNAALDYKPNITMDDGADLVSLLHSKRQAQAKEIWGSTEETTTGVIRLRALEQRSLLKFPVVAVNDAQTKHFFDNRYGTGQSTMDGIIRATNVLLAGKNIVIVGYGWCGKGAAMRAEGLGAKIIVTEVDPVKALEARMDGYDVMPIAQAVKTGDIFVTVTGNINVIDVPHFKVMKDGAIVCNSGHFNVELNLSGLDKITKKKREVRDFVVEHTLSGGKRVYILAEGRLINLAAAEGHPPTVMDMSFANQALAAQYVVDNHGKLEKKVYDVAEAVDQRIACVKLKSMGIKIDTLTKEQKKYLADWEQGT